MGVSSHLFNVVDFPEDGFPTRPIRGSLGMSTAVRKGDGR
jgi:hypothetical protein